MRATPLRGRDEVAAWEITHNLIGRMQYRLKAWLRKRNVQRFDQEDIISTTLVKLYTAVRSNAGTQQDRQCYDGLAWRCLNQAYVDYIRQRLRTSKAVQLKRSEPYDEASHCHAVYSDLWSDEIRELLSKLPEDERHLILLRFGRDLSQQDIARHLHVHPGTVSRRLRSIHNRLRLQLDPPKP